VQASSFSLPLPWCASDVLKKADMQPLVDADADRLQTWKAHLISRVGRTTLTKVTLSTIPIHTSIAVAMPRGTYKAIDKLRRAFIWTGTDTVLGGHCLVAWPRVTQPVELGGLGVVDLTTMGYALRLGWEWLARTQPDRIWSPSACKTDCVIQAMFQVSTTVQVGNGAQMLFWTDRWIGDTSIALIAPDLVVVVAPRRHKTRLVSEALHNSTWISDISGALSVRALYQYVSIWLCLQHFPLQENVPDIFVRGEPAVLGVVGIQGVLLRLVQCPSIKGVA
jgi:hypothetical protein